MSSRGRGRANDAPRGRGATNNRISASRGRGRGSGSGAESASVPEWFYLGQVEDLPVGQPLEIPLTRKRRRMWHPEDHEETPDLSVDSMPTCDAAAGINDDDADLAPQHPVLITDFMPSAPSDASECDVNLDPQYPALFIECGGSGHSTPRYRPQKPNVRRNMLRDQDIDEMNLGSEDDESDEGENFAFAPRGVRMFLDDGEETPQNVNPDFAWPPQHHTPDEVVERDIVESAAPPPALEAGSEGNQFGPGDLFEFVWRPLPTPPIPPEIRREKFTEHVGSCIDPSDPYEAFTAIWSPTIINHIVAETNIYAEHLLVQQLATDTLRDNSRITSWSDVDANEIMVFFAIVMAMSIVRRNVMTDYWCKDQNIFITPQFSAAMSRNRFQLIFRCLHFNDNSRLRIGASSAEAKVYKLEPIIRHLNEVFAEIYKMDQNISLDESLTQWKGWLSLKQCIPNKAAKVGIKSYEVCESKTGYLHRFEIHAKDAEPPVSVSASPISGFIPRLVLRLLEGLENKGHTVWMDNFYNSPALVRFLKIKGFDCVGTLRTNRSLVPVQLNQLESGQLPLRKGALVGCTSGDMDLFVWHDTKRVAFVSTYHGMTVHHCPLENKTKPILVRDYNVSMGGVDKKDQILSAYPIERKRLMVWYKKLFYRLLNVSVLNASVVFNASSHMTNQRIMTQKQFRCTLVMSMLERHRKKQLVTIASAEQTTRILPRNAVAHFTVSYETRESSNERLRRSCVVCKKRVRTLCPTCNVALCMSPCAQQYHTE